MTAVLAILEDANLPADWRSDPAPTSTRTIGDAWVLVGTSAVLRVPSVVVPMEWNYVLNLAHPDFARVTVGTSMPSPFDPRLPLP